MQMVIISPLNGGRNLVDCQSIKDPKEQININSTELFDSSYPLTDGVSNVNATLEKEPDLMLRKIKLGNIFVSLHFIP